MKTINTSATISLLNETIFAGLNQLHENPTSAGAWPSATRTIANTASTSRSTISITTRISCIRAETSIPR